MDVVFKSIVLLAAIGCALYGVSQAWDSPESYWEESTPQPKRHYFYRITAEIKQRVLSSPPTHAAVPQPERREVSAWRDAANMNMFGCAVCFDAAVEMLFDECGHVCMCERCAVEAAGGWHATENIDVVLRCPHCRQSSKLRRVYCA